MEAGVLTIATASDERYAIGLGVMICSALLCAKQKQVRFHIVDGGILPETKQLILDRARRVADARSLKVELHYIDFASIDLPPLDPYYGSLVTYARMYLPEILMEKSLFYVDPDIVCNREFPALEEMESRHPDTLLMGCRDKDGDLKKDCPWPDELGENIGKFPYTYINAGFLWMNLRGLREEGAREKFEVLMERKSRVRYADQTALNFLCRGRIELLPGDFNRLMTKKADLKHLGLDSNFHFVGKKKPWNRKVTKLSLVPVTLFKVAASSFGFADRISGRTSRGKLPLPEYLNVHWKFIFYSLTSDVRVRKSRQIREGWRMLKSLKPAYEAKLHSLVGAPFDGSMPGGVP